MEKDGECPACASTNTVRSESRSQTICRDCGLIFEPFASVALPRTPATTHMILTKEPKKKAASAPKSTAKKPVHKKVVARPAKKTAVRKKVVKKPAVKKKTVKKQVLRKPTTKKVVKKKRK